MKATIKLVKRVAENLRKDFKEGKESGSFSDKLERIVLGYSNANRAGNGQVNIEINGNYKYLFTDIKI